MAARPIDAGNFAEAAYAQLAPLASVDEDNGWTLLIFFGAIGSMYNQMDYLAHADIPWSPMVDIDLVPDEGLPWFGQLIGVAVDTSFDAVAQRQQIRDHVRWKRGTPKAIARSIQPYLTGSKTVDFIERDISAYHFEVITFGDETPATLSYADIYNNYASYAEFYDLTPSYESYWNTDPHAEILATLNLKKPATLQFVWTITPGSPGTYKDYEALYIDFSTYQAAYQAFETYDYLYINP